MQILMVKPFLILDDDDEDEEGEEGEAFFNICKAGCPKKSKSDRLNLGGGRRL